MFAHMSNWAKPETAWLNVSAVSVTMFACVK